MTRLKDVVRTNHIGQLQPIQILPQVDAHSCQDQYDTLFVQILLQFADRESRSKINGRDGAGFDGEPPYRSR